VLGKIQFLREVMGAFGLDKPLVHSEGSLNCPEWNTTQCNPPGNAFFEAQADYVVWLYVRNWAKGLPATIWYSWEGPGWRYSGMLGQRNQPKQSYYALVFLSQELAGATYVGRVDTHPAVQGYAFSSPGKRIWVLWAGDEQPHAVDLPANTRRVYDKYGSDITPGTSRLMVNSPVYVELSP
jgi:hypothetical protein